MKDIVANRYQIEEELGQGGMATVFRAYDQIFQRDIALELLSIKYVTNPNVSSRFEGEVQIIASLEHPAIVPVYDFGYWEECPYLVMRLMSGARSWSRWRRVLFH